MMDRQVSIAFQSDKSVGDYIALAKLVDQYHFDAVSVYCDAPYQPSYGPLLLMAPYISKARLGPAAVSPFRMHPIDIAANSALLAGAAQGGVYIGIARGAWLGDYGIKDPPNPLLGMREALEMLPALLSGERAGYDGEIFKLPRGLNAPYPLPEGKTPIMVGTWGPKLAALAGEMADEVKVGGSANPDFVPHISKFIREGEARAGRHSLSVGIVMGAVTVVDEDRQYARQTARRALAQYLPVVAPLDRTIALEPGFLEKIHRLEREQRRDEITDLISDIILDRFAFAGNAGDLIEQAQRLFAAGASRVEFGTPHGDPPEKGIKIIGEQVLPVLKNKR